MIRSKCYNKPNKYHWRKVLNLIQIEEPLYGGWMYVELDSILVPKECTKFIIKCDNSLDI